MLYSNFNVLVLAMSYDKKYHIGDFYESFDPLQRDMRFHGLKIRNIDYLNGVSLHFDYKDWKENFINL